MGIFDFLKKLSGKKSSEHSLSKYKLLMCANCFNPMTQDEKVCSDCGHNQDNQVIKKQTNIEQMIYGSFVEFYDKNAYIALTNSFNDYIERWDNTRKLFNDKKKVNQIYIELFVLQLTLKTNLFFMHYSKHPHFKEFSDLLSTKVSEIIIKLCTVNEEQCIFMNSLFNYRSNLYFVLLQDQDSLHRIADVLVFITGFIDSGHWKTIIDLDPDIDMFIKEKFTLFPSIHAHLNCYIHIVNIVYPYKLLLNKWEISG
ncbi:MAG: hypothetical protein ACLP2P_08485 [Desulfobaccales bacterium]